MSKSLISRVKAGMGKSVQWTKAGWAGDGGNQGWRGWDTKVSQGSIRIATSDEGVEVYSFDENMVLSWSAEFVETTPVNAVLVFLRTAIEESNQ